MVNSSFPFSFKKALKAFICNNNYYILNKMWEKVFNIQHL